MGPDSSVGLTFFFAGDGLETIRFVEEHIVEDYLETLSRNEGPSTKYNRDDFLGSRVSKTRSRKGAPRPWDSSE